MYVILVVLILAVAVFGWGYSGEKKQWNNGICELSGELWIRFDTDSQGGRGYKDGKGNHCWISYNGVDKGYNVKTGK